MKNTKTVLAEIRKFCRNNAKEALVRKYARYFTEGFDSYGVPFEAMERQRDIWLARYRAELGIFGFLDLGDLLVENGKQEEAGFAIWFASAFRDEFSPAVLRRLGSWLDAGLRNWAVTDFICGEVLSRFLLEHIVPLKAFSAWRTSVSKWKRRAVPVTLIKPLKEGGTVEEYLEFIGPMMEDQERAVQQGLGWFLREAWKKHPAQVEDFLLQWKDCCGRTIVQYATERMTAPQKTRFKRSKPQKAARAGSSPAARPATRKTKR